MVFLFFALYSFLLDSISDHFNHGRPSTLLIDKSFPFNKHKPAEFLLLSFDNLTKLNPLRELSHEKLRLKSFEEFYKSLALQCINIPLQVI